MAYLKYGIVAVAMALFAAPSVEAQNFQQLGTRRGALTGAIIGAVIGDQNNEALAGAAIGGLVGGAIGNVSGRNLDRQFAGGQPVYGYGGYGHGGYAQPTYYGGGGFAPAVNFQYHQVTPIARPVPVRPVYGGGYYGARPVHGGYYVRPGCGYGRGW